MKTLMQNVSIMSMPKRVTLELTNRCNRACEGCPRHKTNYPEGDMSWNLFESIVTQLPSSTVIVPFFRGESTLHPRFADMMGELQRFESVQLATNGDYLTRSHQKAILGTCNFVSLSLHNFTYPANAQKGWLSFLYEANGNGADTQISILEPLIPEGVKDRFVRSWLKHANNVRVYVEHSHRGFGDIKNPKFTAITDNSLPCQKPFEDMVVCWDGKVALCNHDWKNEYFLGDLNLQYVKNVWNNQEYLHVRCMHEAGLRRRVGACQTCDYWMTSYLPNKMFGELYTN